MITLSIMLATIMHTLDDTTANAALPHMRAREWPSPYGIPTDTHSDQVTSRDTVEVVFRRIVEHPEHDVGVSHPVDMLRKVPAV